MYIRNISSRAISGVLNKKDDLKEKLFISY